METVLDFETIPLCGRREELKILEDTVFSHTLERRVLLLKGQSGSGKSSLLQALRDKVLSADAFCLTGKHEEFIDDPFLALADALSDLITQILKDHESSLPGEIENGLSNQQLNVLSLICPRIYTICSKKLASNEVISQDNEIDGPTSEEMKERHDLAHRDRRNVSRNELSSSLRMFEQLGLALRSLFRIVSNDRLVVIMQDDVHWAKTDYWSLIEPSLVDQQSPSLVFVAAYRPQPENRRDMDRLLEFATPRTIEITNLEVKAVAEIAVNLTRRSCDDCKVLAQVLHRRTNGNAMFFIQFLAMLEKKTLIYYSTSRLCWEWDHESVVMETSTHETIVNVIAGRLSDLPDALKAALSVAACIGPSCFNVRILDRLRESHGFGVHENIEPSENNLSQLQSLLGDAVSEGMLERLGEFEYKFTHDRIRETARSLKGERGPDFYRYLGQALFSIVDATDNIDLGNERDSLVLLAADHMNAGKSTTTNEREILQLVDLNFRASQISLKKMALNPAKGYIETAMVMVEKIGGWTREYDLMLKLSNFYVEVLYCSGEMEQCCKEVDSVGAMSRTFQETCPILLFKFFALYQLDRRQDARHFATSVLRDLGFAIPENKLLVKLSIFKNSVWVLFRDAVSSLSEDMLLGLPDVQDPNVVTALDFCFALFEMGLSTADLETQMLASLHSTRLTLKYGFTEHAPSALTSCAVMLASMGDYDGAERMAQTATKMAEKVDSLSRAKVFAAAGFFCTHWKHPISKALDMVIEAKRIVMDRGHASSLCIVFTTYTLLYLMSGLTLVPLSKDAMKMHSMICDLKLSHYTELCEVPVQYVLNLMGRSKDPTVLSGEIIEDQDASFNRYKLHQNDRAMGFVRLFRMILGFLFGDMDLALSMSRKLYSAMHEGPTYILPVRLFFQGLIACEWARRSACGRASLFLVE